MTRACWPRRVRGPLSGSRRCGSSQPFRRPRRRVRLTTRREGVMAAVAAVVAVARGRIVAVLAGRSPRMRSLKFRTTHPRRLTTAELEAAAVQTTTIPALAVQTTNRAIATTTTRKRRRRRRTRLPGMRLVEPASVRWHCSTWPRGTRYRQSPSHPRHRRQLDGSRPVAAPEHATLLQLLLLSVGGRNWKPRQHPLQRAVR